MSSQDNLHRLVVDVATGETTVVPFTDEETAAYLAEQEKIAAAEAAAVLKEKAKANARQALLDKLGITEDEAKLLLG